MMKWFGLIGVVLVLGLGWIWVSRVQAVAQPDHLQPSPAVGYLAPDFELATLDGDVFTLSDQRGTPLVLNFWATWCGPCRSELPSLQDAAERYEGEVMIVGVDQGEETAVVQAYVDQMGLSFPIPMDSALEAANIYNVKGMPTTYFVDAEGVIRYIWSGEMNSVILAEGISKIWP